MMQEFKFLGDKTKEQQPYPMGVLEMICDSIQRKIPIRQRAVTYLHDGYIKTLKITRFLHCVNSLEFHYEIRHNDIVDSSYFNIPRSEFQELIGGLEEFYTFNYRENTAYDARV